MRTFTSSEKYWIIEAIGEDTWEELQFLAYDPLSPLKPLKRESVTNDLGAIADWHVDAISAAKRLLHTSWGQSCDGKVKQAIKVINTWETSRNEE